MRLLILDMGKTPQNSFQGTRSLLPLVRWCFTISIGNSRQLAR